MADADRHGSSANTEQETMSVYVDGRMPTEVCVGNEMHDQVTACS